MSCLFQLEQYGIEHVIVIPEKDYDPALKTHSGNVTASLNKAQHNEDPLRYRLTLETVVEPIQNSEINCFPYKVSIKGWAAFVFKEAYEEAEVERFMNLNGASILYGLMRAQIAQITAQSIYGQFLLPTVNFAARYERSKNAGTVKGDRELPQKQTKKKAKPRKKQRL